MEIQIESGDNKPIIVRVDKLPSRSKKFMGKAAKALAKIEGVSWLMAHETGWTIYVLPNVTKSGKRHDMYGAIRAIIQAEAESWIASNRKGVYTSCPSRK